DRVAQLCGGDRRSVPLQGLEGGWATFRAHPEEVSIWADRPQRSHQQDRRCLVREALYQAAHVILTKPVKGCTQRKSGAMRIAKRAGMQKAKVALARKLAVIMHRMLVDRTAFNPTAKRAALMAAA